MTRSPVRRTLFVLLFATGIPLAVACKKPPPPVPDAEPAPVATDAGVLQLAPLDDDAGDGGDADAEAGHKWTGPGMNPNEARVRQCCAVLRSRIKQLGAAPEVAQLSILVAQCDAIAAQVHANPNAPELSAIKSMPGCQ